MIKLPKLINKSELARAMGIHPQNLNDKLKGQNRHRFTEDDKQKAIDAMEAALKEIKTIKV